MTTIQIKNGLELLSQESTSSLLLSELQTRDSLTYPTLLKVVAYLADHPQSQLENGLKEKLSKEAPETTLLNIQSVSMFALLHHRLKMVEVCQRVVSLDQLKKGLSIPDVKTVTAREVCFTPAPTRLIEKISSSAAQKLRMIPTIFGKIFNLFHTMTVGTLALVGITLITTLNNPPGDLIEGLSHFQVHKILFDWFKYLIDSYVDLFPSSKHAVGVGVCLIGIALMLHFIHSYLHLGYKETIDKRGLFKNMSTEARMGKMRPMRGRLKEKEQVQTAWDVPPGEKFRIALLKGPTGCGKTEFVKGLAWETVNDRNSFVYKKEIYSINTIQIVQEGIPYLDKVLESLAGREDEVVLFFDEGQAAGGSMGTISPVIEYLKTKILEKNIRCILATTDEEYKQNIKHNTPFKDRCTIIKFDELSDADSKKILKDKVELDQDRTIEVDENAYAELLKVAKLDPKFRKRHNPRKIIDLYKDVRSHIHSWKPKKLKDKLARATTARDDLKASCLAASNQDSDWSNTKQGEEMLRQLQDKEQEIARLTETLENQNVELEKLAQLRARQPHYRQRYYELVHRISDQKSPEIDEKTQKEFLYLKHLLRPALQSTIQSEVRRLSDQFEEQLPMKIDAALIQRLYPHSYRLPQQLPSLRFAPLDSIPPKHLTDADSIKIDSEN